ncbi:MAG: tRNA (adenosine(37)-N6)-threonylcarbamoyltransferase complex dimerization subunit type 1 TsaB [Clostridia bacterium]|nr:tRNA (adenosine(37)-N6)-threonylcarbamoyltransferase complex dimerization subunit type 1 TsaB [Clostridia bacterium]
MLVLGLDTATKALSVAIAEAGQVVVELYLNTDGRHAVRLLPLIDQALKWAGVSMAEIGAVAVSAGPGSFTGLRIGMATAKGLCQALGKPIVGVPTLDVLAANAAGFDGLVLPLLYARQKQVYTALYQTGLGPGSSAGQRRLTDYRSFKVEALGPWLKHQLEVWGQDHGTSGQGARDARILALGDVPPDYLKPAQELVGPSLGWGRPEQMYPRATQVIQLAWAKLARGEGDDLYRLAPLYIMRSSAEEKLASR